jgi:hypothetical protein
MLLDVANEKEVVFEGGEINYNLSTNSHAQGLCPLSTIFINNGCMDVLNYV